MTKVLVYSFHVHELRRGFEEQYSRRVEGPVAGLPEQVVSLNALEDLPGGEGRLQA